METKIENQFTEYKAYLKKNEDGKWVLLTSPQDMLPKDYEYHNGNGTLCLIGDYDEKTDTTYSFLDITLWKMMFDEGIIIYDPMIFYAINNYKMKIQPIYIHI